MPRKRWPPRMRTSFPLALEMRAKCPQSHFSMIARAQRFFDPGFAVGKQPGKQQASLHLRAGYRHLVIDRFQAWRR